MATLSTPSPTSRPQSINSRRRSVQASRSYISASPGGSPSSSSSSRAQQDGLMGGLRERSEDALRLASREELEECLRQQWAEKDEANTKLSQIQKIEHRLLYQVESQTQTISGLENRLHEVLDDQERMENNFASHSNVIEKLRAQLKLAEKEKKDLDRRYAEQEKSFEAERRALRAEEELLKSRLSPRPSPLVRSTPTFATSESSSFSTSARFELLKTPQASSSPIAHLARPQTDEIAILQSELAGTLTELHHLQASHSQSQSTLTALTSELHEVKGLTSRLQEENEQWELLMRERTLEGGMTFGMGGFDDSTISRSTRNGNGDGSVGLKGLGLGMEVVEDRSSGTVLGGREQWKGTSGRRNKGLSLEQELAGFGGIQEEGESEQKADIHALEAEIKDAKTEIKALQDSNNALNMYCSKIIDRIIGTEGFENILSNDYDPAKKSPLDTRRGFPKAQLQSPRPLLGPALKALKDVPAERSDVLNFAAAPNLPDIVEVEKKPEEVEVARTPRLLSAPPAIVAQKKANRSSMMDWRSLGGLLGGGGSSSAATSPSQLIVNRAPSPISIAIPPSTVPSPNPRVDSPRERLNSPREKRIYEEDDEDRKERAKLHAVLKLMGVDQSESPDPAATVPQPSSKPTTPLMRSHSLKSPRSTSVSPRGPNAAGTGPLSRLSSLLGNGKPTSASPLSPEIEKLDPLEPVTEDSAAAVLKAFDKREKEQAALVRKGQGSGFTCPSPDLAENIADRRRLSATQRRVSGSDMGGLGNDAIDRRMSDGPGGSGHIANKSSVSTLWSIGGRSSSPDSMMRRDSDMK